MNINVQKAAELFYKNPDFELVYFEAIANAIDAQATEITIINRLEEGNSIIIEELLKLSGTPNQTSMTSSLRN